MKFNLLEKLLPPEETVFYTCFENAANICEESAKLFSAIINNGNIQDIDVKKAKELKSKSNQAEKEILNNLRSVFVTPIDRDDIQLVASLLNKIAKRIVKACINLEMYGISDFNKNLKGQSEVLLQATSQLKIVIALIRQVNHLKEIAEANHKMKEIENHGDEILHDALKELFSGSFDALHVIKFRDIHKQIEQALNTCFFISDTVLNISLKHG